ncbi:hypothetical protein BVY01_01875 [bacterium I07]|nr:hypothetical protein BVY01_01875 [bacterium I07]
MKFWTIAVLLVLSFAMIASAGQPKVVKAEINPAVAEPGETVVMMVEFTGKAKDIKEVSFVIREYLYDQPRRYLSPKKDSKKNIWVLEETIPYDAPYDIFSLDVRGLDSKGKEIVSKGLEDNETGRTATTKLEIKDK